MPRVCVLAFWCCLLALGCTGCAGSSESDPNDAQTPAVIDISISGDSVTPNGERVQVRVGQPIDLVVMAEEPGEIHVHSRPEEQEFAFEPGTTTFKIEVDSPGVVEIESHDLNQTIVQLEVR